MGREKHIINSTQEKVSQNQGLVYSNIFDPLSMAVSARFFNKEELNIEYFQHMDRETGLMVGEFLQSESIVKKMKSDSEKGDEMNMCKALEDLYNDGVERGREQGERQKLKSMVKKKVQKGYSVEAIADMLEEDVETIQELVDELSSEQ